MRTELFSFRQLFEDGARIEIPMIQRDYAQGRDDQSTSQVRKYFLQAFHEALSAPAHSSPLDLDFVYGRWRLDDRTMEPLDGQQRLTTLFLLHWYLACLDDDTFRDFGTWMNSETGSCFTYRTRPSAGEFFDYLVRHQVDPDKLPDGESALSDWLVDRAWFMRRWRRDPTVEGCLTMLDAIHRQFQGERGAYQRLVSADEPPVVFRLLLLEDFDLSDDLYIKMNARGKALTDFEVFKAQFEEFVGDTFGDEPCPYSSAEHGSSETWHRYVSRQFDTGWTDFMWRHRDNAGEIDARFMHLIRALALTECVEAEDPSDDSEQLANRIQRLLEEPAPTLAFYEEIGCRTRGFVERLVELMDILSSSTDQDALGFLRSADYFDERPSFERILLAKDAPKAGVTLVEWVKFYAYCAFLRARRDDLTTQTAKDAFHEWMRVVCNLADNSDLNQIRMVRALRGVRDLVDQGAGCEFLQHVATGGIDAGFIERQRNEEKLKAQLLLKDASWRQLIEEAETHPYFRGDIEFLLRFCGVYERWLANDGCDWTDEEDEEFRRSFETWYDRACAIFPPDRSEDPGLAKFSDDFLWRRALLTTGDYLLSKRSNRSFVVDSDRDLSWKQLLRTQRRDLVRKVLERIDPDDAVGSLQKIIDEALHAPVEGEHLDGWRRRLVAEPRLIAYCKRKMIRLNRGNSSVYLLSKTQRNGYHADLFVYDLYLALSDRAKSGALAPFSKPKRPIVKGAVDPHQLVLRAKNPRMTLKAWIQDGSFEFEIVADARGELSLRPEWSWSGGRWLRGGVPVESAGEVVIQVVAELRQAQPA